MEEQIFNAILVYNINQKDRIIGKLRNFSKNETLNNIRPYIKKMTENNEFISIKKTKDIETIDKDVEYDFTIEDIIIQEKGELRIYIGNIDNLIKNPMSNIYNNNTNRVLPNKQNINNNNNYIINNNINNKEPNVFNQFKNQKNQLNINNMSNNFNNKNLKNNINIKNNINNNINLNLNNNMNMNNNLNNMNNNLNNMNNMFDMMNLNNNDKIMMNNMMIVNNQNIINNNNFNRMNNIINNKIKIYNVKFKVSQGIIYNTKVRHYKIMNYFLFSLINKISIINKSKLIFFFDLFEEERMINLIKEKLYYNGVNIKFDVFKNTVEYYFKNDLNPIIFINDKEYYITIIKFIFKDNHGNQVEIFANCKKSIYDFLIDYLKEIDHYSYPSYIDINKIQFFYNNKIIEDKYKNCYIKIDEYFKIDYTKVKNEFLIYVNDINNLIKAINIIFIDNHGNKVEIIANKKNTIYNIIMRYLYKVKHEELITKMERKDEIQFIYKQKKIEYDDNTIIEYYFKNDNNPIIQVNDFDGILLIEPLTKYDIKYATSQGYTFVYESSIGITMKEIISNYLDYIDHPELINKRDNIIFLFNGEKINENITARKFFKNETKPKILVMDKNNLLINASKFIGKKLGLKISVIFKSSLNCISMIFNYGTTIDEMMKKYLLRIKQPEYINSNKIHFLYNAKTFNFGDQTPIGDIFGWIRKPAVIVFYSI